MAMVNPPVARQRILWCDVPKMWPLALNCLLTFEESGHASKFGKLGILSFLTPAQVWANSDDILKNVLRL